MSIRITKTSGAPETVLRVDGQLCSENVAELTKEFQDIVGPVALELSGLQSADLDGIGILQEIASLGAELRGASPYVKLLLEQKP